MANSEVGRKCIFCCGLWRKKTEAPGSQEHSPDQDDTNAHGVENDMQPSEYYNVDEIHDMNRFRDPTEAFYEEVPREGIPRKAPPLVDSGPIYAEPTTAVGLNFKSNAKPPRAAPCSVSVKEKHAKVRLAETFGADGTVYMDVRRTLPSKTSPPNNQPMFNKSEYAFIDHTITQMPAPPKSNFSQ